MSLAQLIVLPFDKVSGFRKTIDKVLLLSESFIVNLSLHFLRWRLTTLLSSVAHHIVSKLNVLHSGGNNLFCVDLGVFENICLFLNLIHFRTYAL